MCDIFLEFTLLLIFFQVLYLFGTSGVVVTSIIGFGMFGTSIQLSSVVTYCVCLGPKFDFGVVVTFIGFGMFGTSFRLSSSCHLHPLRINNNTTKKKVK